MSTRVVGITVLVFGLVLLAGCASRPTNEELSESIMRSAEANPGATPISEEQANCIALQLLGSSLSDTTLEGLAADFANPQVLKTEASRLSDTVNEAARQCA